jgi:succinate dehydrogenase (ubiquinone) membrane anchor subunit
MLFLKPNLTRAVTTWKPIGLFSTIGNRFSYNRNVQTKTQVPNMSLGSYHWNTERVLSLVTLPLFASAVFHPTAWIDAGLGIVLPLHCYLGVECMIQDYVPFRRVGVLHTILIWTLRVCTGLTMYGCYVINTKDIGLVGVVKRLWTGKLNAA